MDPIGPISIQAARGYGVVSVPRVTPVRAVGWVEGSSRTVDGGARDEGVSGASEVASLRLFQRQGGSKASPRVGLLVGAVVAGKVDFSAGDAQSRTSSLALYHHPAEMNAAATGVGLGRMLDTTA